MTHVLSHANSPHQIPGGMCKYITKYNQSISGYKERLRADRPSIRKCTLRIRQIEYDSQDLVDWVAEMAYFQSPSQAIGKLQIEMPSTYFRLDTKEYLSARMGENGHLPPPAPTFLAAIRKMWEISREMPEAGKFPGEFPGEFPRKFPGKWGNFPGNSTGNIS